jgi:hypothetical protein
VPLADALGNLRKPGSMKSLTTLAAATAYRPPMTRRTVGRTLLAATCATCGATAMPAHAGQPVTTGTDTMQLEATVSPAVTAPRGKPRPVALQLELRLTSTTSGTASAIRTGWWDLPPGMNVNPGPKPSCRLSALILHRSRGCSKRWQVGSGSAVLDGRPAGLGYPLAAKVRVLSGIVDVPPPPKGFKPLQALIIYAFAPGADVLIPVAPNLVVNPSSLFMSNSRATIPPGVGIEDLKFRIRSMRWPKRAGGKPLIQAPTKCAGSWRFTANMAFATTGLSPTDDVPCSTR